MRWRWRSDGPAVAHLPDRNLERNSRTAFRSPISRMDIRIVLASGARVTTTRSSVRSGRVDVWVLLPTCRVLVSLVCSVPTKGSSGKGEVIIEFAATSRGSHPTPFGLGSPQLVLLDSWGHRVGRCGGRQKGNAPRRTKGKPRPAGMTRRSRRGELRLLSWGVSEASRCREPLAHARRWAALDTWLSSRRFVDEASPLVQDVASFRTEDLRPGSRKASRSWMNRELRPHGLRDGSLGSIFFRRPEDPPHTVASVPKSIVETRGSERLCDGGAEICRSGRPLGFCALCRVKEKTRAGQATNGS